ncbi:MAG: sugar transferase [Armatimonadota bacterium]
MGSINGFAKPGDMIHNDIRQMHKLYIMEKRALDIAISFPLVIVLLPFLPVIALAVKLDSRGPLFHKRKVVGREKREFNAFKLRTMLDGIDPLEYASEEERKELENNHKLRSDRRVTRVGKILRKTSIDELPQLMNVLLGQMSLVGPRMISFEEIEKFGIYQDKILSVKPGITGLWQVSGRSKLSYEDRVRLNVYYVDHRSLKLDLLILIRTIPAVITGNGAY